MKLSLRYLVISLITVVFVTGCSRQPLQEINDAKAAVDSLVSEGGEKYLPVETKKLNEDLNTAIAEVKAQDTKIFSNYGKAKRMLASVKTEAETINAKLPAKKEEAKKDAIAALEEARGAIDEAKALLEKASSGKRAKAVPETIGTEMMNLEDSFSDLRTQFEREDYLAIAAGAADIRRKAQEISSLISQAPPARTGKKRK